jgi:CO/xanthine dehydrogenase Mo-binding subunit
MTGTATGFAAIAAETFGVDPAAVRIVQADTSTAPYSGASSGSKITYTVGRAVERAATEARAMLLSVAAEELEIDPADLEIADGAVQPRGNPARATPLPELAAKILDYGSPYSPVEGHGRVSLAPAPQTVAQLSHVRVDSETGRVTVLGQVIAQDVGRALNPALVEGQMHGGTAQGLGWALLEELRYDEGGQLVTGTFVDYALPSTTDVPPIGTEIVEVPAPDGPFGAKGVGEGPVVAAAAAVANAVAAATGVHVDQLPMTPERVWRWMTASVARAASTSAASSFPAGEDG